jgi:hypothetical protein
VLQLPMDEIEKLYKSGLKAATKQKQKRQKIRLGQQEEIKPSNPVSLLTGPDGFSLESPTGSRFPMLISDQVVSGASTREGDAALSMEFKGDFVREYSLQRLAVKQNEKIVRVSLSNLFIISPPPLPSPSLSTCPNISYMLVWS